MPLNWAHVASPQLVADPSVSTGPPPPAGTMDCPEAMKAAASWALLTDGWCKGLPGSSRSQQLWHQQPAAAAAGTAETALDY